MIYYLVLVVLVVVQHLHIFVVYDNIFLELLEHPKLLLKMLVVLKQNHPIIQHQFLHQTHIPNMKKEHYQQILYYFHILYNILQIKEQTKNLILVYLLFLLLPLELNCCSTSYLVWIYNHFFWHFFISFRL